MSPRHSPTPTSESAIDPVDASSDESFEVALRRAAQRVVAKHPDAHRVHLGRQERTLDGAYLVSLLVDEAC